MGFIDDRDPRVIYRGQWVHAGANERSPVLNKTLSLTSTDNSSIQLAFNADDLDLESPPSLKDIGLTISVCGSAAVTEANRNLTVLFTVDNLKPEKFVMGNIRIGNCFYHSPAVDAKRSHVLTVNITNVSYSRGSFGFDYASVNPVALPKSSHRVRTIVGIVVGVAAFLILCLGVFWLWRRKSKRKAYVASRAKDLEHRMAVLAVRKSTLPVAPTPSATGPIDTKVDPFADPVPDQKQAS